MPTSMLLTIWFLLCIPGSVHLVRALNEMGATTHPEEAEALNSIFVAWNIQAPKEWNTSGELCSGIAIDDIIIIDDQAHNPLIKCDCSFNESTVCRITALKVYKMNVVGPIPPQLWTLTYLTNLNLAQNFLTGPLSPAVGNLVQMEWLTFGINALSGPFPKEIGLLTKLKSLSIGLNNFSGSIPAEIGNIENLQKIYLSNSGLRGEIPSSFASLVNLQEALITDLDITGRIPEFIGKWTKLKILKILGTGLNGPIPSSFSNLTSLGELNLGDISNGNSSLEFIKDMKSLTILVLRNNNLTGTIPSNFGEYLSLQQVDLSFNKLHGPIPASLFNLNSLALLFLGNNTLNGSLPTQKSQTLTNIDVSYNDLAGTLPLWVSLPNLKLVLPGLKCLQKTFPCNRGKGIYSDFSIKCGGPQIRSLTGEVFEREDEDLGSASFFVNDVNRWATSSVGLYAGSSNYIWVINSLDGELFQTARRSSSSLRYYGLGLENGGYTVKLQFAEIEILGSKDWKGLGRRRFDIYIQGRLVEKDIDIRPTDDDTTVRPVQREYKAHVTENYLEIHLFWAGKGTFTIPNIGTCGPLISTISAKPGFIPTVSNRPPSKKKNRTGTVVGASVSLGLLSIIAGVVIFIIRKSRKHNTDDAELLSMDVKPYTFAYSELKSATQDFNPSNKLGEGGFGSVYKVIPELRGILHLDWSTRFEICIGVARGLAYLHEEASVRIVHRDVKASNILLDSKLLPKISDFGLARIYDDKKSHISTRVAGTIGYVAPEYAMRGHLTEKTDVYAFGIVALELVSGRKNSDMNVGNERKYLLEWAWNLHENRREVELIDQALTEFNMEEVKRVIGIALLCTYSSHSLRPQMSKVVAMLSGDTEVSEVTSKLGYLTDWRSDDTSSSSFSAFQMKETNASAYNSTSFVMPSDSGFKQMLGVKINEGR
ncbi:hypothetical protein BRARA_B02452 [Brassica rapa]|uniref:non-specific serine/threonine protein kinase n=1 Tax=Brassica campestris TaxID=3711 RepID=A0A398AJJ0_BRACM|nr:hypothetical protein BRARA_B02452 [Brassica rapa]